MSFRGYIISAWDKMNKEYNYLLKSEKYQCLQIVDYHNLIWYNQNWREELGSVKLPIKNGGYFSMKGDDTYAHKCRNLEERSSKLSAHEIVQTIIGINLLIVSVVNVCIVALKKDNKK